uniref:Anoctamin n=1 Tax=Mesocestoides corti TaxID=53468 RepID=A0A5K3EHJ5_MESCO
MVSEFGFFEIFDLMDQYSSLPPVSEIPKKPVQFYYEKAKKLRKYCKPELLNNEEIANYPKFKDWCNYITRFSTCNIAPHPTEFFSPLNSPVSNTASLSVVATSSAPATIGPQGVFGYSCYDDYLCEPADKGSLFFLVYGAIFTLICSAGLLLNLACLVGFNRSTNRSGATLYFSIICLMDCVYLGIKLALKSTVHLNDVDYSGQVNAYAKRAAYFIPTAVPLLTFSEVVSVWLIVCVLFDRYNYLQRGYFSKSVTSLKRHIRIASVVIGLSFCYSVPKFFEYKAEPNPAIPTGYRVVYTTVGNSTVYRSLMDYLLNIPLEMFLPYLAVGLITCQAVSKMVDLGSSKWKAVTNFCSPSAYCCCGYEFANCFSNSRRKQGNKTPPLATPAATAQTAIPNSVVSHSSTDYIDGHPTTLRALSYTSGGGFDEVANFYGGRQVYYCGIPFEKRSDLMPFYFLVPPPRQTVKETANVVIAVCLGFLLLFTKIPKLVLTALELEKYIEMNEVYTRMTQECLNMAFIIFKPPIYLILGVHFRHALTGLFCCACLYTPVIRGGIASQDGQHHAEAAEHEIIGGDDKQPPKLLIDGRRPDNTEAP